MLVTLSGVTGVGKSFFKNMIIEKLGFRNLPVVTTREKREGEINGIDKEFVTDDEFNNLKKLGIIQVDFELAGKKYAYKKERLQSNENQVTEVHYDTIYELRKCCSKDILAIYMIPYDLEKAKLQLKNRKLPNEMFEKRLAEIDEHVKKYSENEDLRNQFDYVLINDYTEKTVQKVIEIIKNRGG